MEAWTVIGSVAGVVAAVWTFLAYRAAVPRVAISASVLPFGPHKGSLCIEVLNGSGAETTIDFDGLVFKRTPGFAPADEATGLKRMQRFMRLELSGPELPHRLLGHDCAVWHANLDRVNWDLSHSLSPDDHGKVVLRVGARSRQVPVRHYVAKLVFQVGRRLLRTVATRSPGSAGLGSHGPTGGSP